MTPAPSTPELPKLPLRPGIYKMQIVSINARAATDFHPAAHSIELLVISHGEAYQFFAFEIFAHNYHVDDFVEVRLSYWPGTNHTSHIEILG